MNGSISNSEIAGQVIHMTAAGLEPFVERVLRPYLAPDVPWTELLARLDQAKGAGGKNYSPSDLHMILRAVTERLGTLGFPFNEHLSRVDSARASELREFRNRWAHNVSLDDDDTQRMIDTARRLLATVGAEREAAQVAALLAPTTGAAPAVESANNTEPVIEVLPAAKIEPEPSVAGTGVSVTFTAEPVLSYALAHNRIPVVSLVEITNTGAARPGAIVRIDLGTADSPLSHGSEYVVDLGDGTGAMIKQPDLRLEPAYLLTVEERRPAWIRVVVEHEGVVVANARHDVTVLAARQWVFNPPQLSLELLASFVQPNHPAITPLLREASNLLRERTGSGSLEGYQANDPDRIDGAVWAIFDAMRARDIRYANPPASWGEFDATGGQKIRDAADVLEGRLGTCLDTVVTFASALEQVDIHPLLWLCEGHIFLGYWRAGGLQAEQPATLEAIEFVNAVDRGLIGVVETTLVTAGPEATFAIAQQAPREERLGGRAESLRGVLDVIAARRQGVYPLPVRTIGSDGTIVVTEYLPNRTDGVAYADVERGDVIPTERADVPRRVSTWKNALLDLTLRNRLINFTPSARIRLAVPGDDASHVEDLVNVGKALTLLPSDALSEIARERGAMSGREVPAPARTALLRERAQVFSDVTAASYDSRFRSLAYRAKTIEQETGANNLYLAFGTIIWRVNDRDIESPLILVPVRLEATRGGRFRVVLDEAGGSTPNYCLLEKLRITHDLRIPGLAEPESDGAGIDLAAAFAAVRDSIAAAGLPYRVEPTVDLAILQFAKFRLWKDLDENWEAFTENPLVAHLVHRPTEPFPGGAREIDDDLDALLLDVPAPADASQLAAVAAAVAGETFVLEGPPGTGKSQTITNLLARATAAGKRVLFVAEKSAALEVVRRRLDEVGLGPLSLDLHDKGSRPTAVRQQIKQALEHRVLADSEGLAATRDAVDGSRRVLRRYAERLHEPNDVGLTYYSARTRRLALEDSDAAAVPRSLVQGAGATAHHAIRSLLRDLPDLADRARPRSAHPWAMFDASIADPSPVLDAVAELDAHLSALLANARIAPILHTARDADALTWTARLAGAPAIDLSLVDVAQSRDWQERARAALAELAAIQADFAAVPGLRPDLDRADWSRVHDAALAADRRNVFVRGRARREVLEPVIPSFEPDRVPVARELSRVAAAASALQRRSHAARERLSALPNFPLPAGADLLTADLTTLGNTVDWAIHLAAQIGDRVATEGLPQAWRAYYATPRGADDATQLITLNERWAAVAPHVHADESPVAAWIAGLEARDSSGRGRVAAIAWLDLIAALEPLRGAGLDEFRSALLTGRTAADDALVRFDAGIAEASLAERAESNALDGFSASAHDRTVAKYSTGVESLRALQATAIPASMLEARKYDSQSTSGRIGELRRQLERQRGGLAVRDLLDRYGDLVIDLMPCVLMGPESVARFLMPDRALFDIVVFDEASQIRVADAIGAMGRARSVVVVGDSKQMPPSSFADVSIQGDDDEERTADDIVDEESILTECVAARVPARALTWHYRSQDEVLIQFSNEHYYGNLSSFPSPLHATRESVDSDHGLRLVRVNGTFLRDGAGKSLRTNPVEAEAIVAEVRRRFAASPDIYPSIGVITFNAQQRRLIDDLLRDAGDERIVEALDAAQDGLFVKNLENVQGDERDTILFSTAFSANAKGVLPLNFGPVGMAGGERRLNVAITRARRQVMVFSSFDPSDLRADATSSLGLKHLRAYLELAQSAGRSAGRRGTGEDAVDRHREQIAFRLRERGLHVATDVGLSDFRVDLSVATLEEPDRPLVAVLLDSATWATRATVADRDALPTQVLGSLMRWPRVERVWMPSWLSDADSVVERLVQTVESAREDAVLLDLERDLLTSAPAPIASRQESAGDVAEMSSPSSPKPAVVAVASATPTARVEAPVFVPWSLQLVGSPSDLDVISNRAVMAEIQRLMEEIVAVEGPVHRIRLAKFIANAFGLERVAAARVAAILRCVPPELEARSEPAFLWPADIDRDTWTGHRRTPAGVARPLEHVSPREVANAMAHLSRRNAGMYDDELRRETLREFGITRMTSNMTELLDAALAFGTQHGILTRSDSGLVVAT